jgi:Fe-S cluster biogenesis protein NfuA
MIAGMRERAEAAVRDYIEPLVKVDGGTVEVVEADEKRVVVHLGGAYAGCPSQPFTLEGVIVPVLKRVLGEHIEVTAASSSRRRA